MKNLTWVQRIATAASEERGYFTAGDFQAAASWATCAVGEFDIPNPLGGPADSRLDQLGRKFTVAVEEDNVPGAARLYRAIARRATVVQRAATARKKPK